MRANTQGTETVQADEQGTAINPANKDWAPATKNQLNL